MKLALRRIGNSLGVILPKTKLDEWGLVEGDSLELTEHGVRVSRRAGFSHEELDELKRRIALTVVGDFSIRQIRAQILSNLHRWKRQGMWISAYDEWQEIASRGEEGALFASMLGRDDTAVRLRQSMPFVGLLPVQQVRRLYEEAAG